MHHLPRVINPSLMPSSVVSLLLQTPLWKIFAFSSPRGPKWECGFVQLFFLRKTAFCVAGLQAFTQYLVVRNLNYFPPFPSLASCKHRYLLHDSECAVMVSLHHADLPRFLCRSSFFHLGNKEYTETFNVPSQGVLMICFLSFYIWRRWMLRRLPIFKFQTCSAFNFFSKVIDLG